MTDDTWDYKPDTVTTQPEREMTDDERQKLILQRLAQLGTIGFHDPDISCRWILDGHDEIERLAGLVNDYKLTFGDIHDVSPPSRPDEQHGDGDADCS